MRFRSTAEDERIRTVHAAIDVGITSLDTAPLYDFGEIESMLGRALRTHRERVEILSKVGLRWDGDHGDVLFEFTDGRGVRRTVRRDGRPSSIRRDIEESLKRLRTDRIDLCQIHQPDRLVPIEDSLGELARLAEEGKIREMGVSNFSSRELAAAVSVANPLSPRSQVVSQQLHYNLIERRAEQDVIPLARENGIGLLAYSPLEAGVLAGKLLDAPPTADRASGADDDPAGSDFRFQTPAFQPTNVEQIHRALRECALPIAHRHEACLSQICLAWLLAQPGITGVVAGASTTTQVLENARAAEIALTPEECRTLGDRFADLRIDPDAGMGVSHRIHRLGRRVGGKIKRVLGFDSH